MYEPRNIEADAKFIEAGGLKNWGCFAVLLAILVLVLLFVVAHALLIHLIGEPAAWWGSLIFIMGVTTGVIYLWSRRRRRQRSAQEQIWRQAMGNGTSAQKTSQE